MADCFQGFKNQESIMEKGIYEYIYISAFDDPFENILCIYFYIFFFWMIIFWHKYSIIECAP